MPQVGGTDPTSATSKRCRRLNQGTPGLTNVYLSTHHSPCSTSPAGTTHASPDQRQLSKMANQKSRAFALKAPPISPAASACYFSTSCSPSRNTSDLSPIRGGLGARSLSRDTSWSTYVSSAASDVLQNHISQPKTETKQQNPSSHARALL